VLPAEQRLRDSTTFREVVRRGRRSGGRLIVLHLHEPAPDAAPERGPEGGPPVAVRPPRAGLVVSRSVGNAVVRNPVKRRLRHLLRARMATLRPGAVLVVRALPPASAASSTELDEELGRGLGRLTGQVTR
jgi:ribonuclease P protein component